jgi:predicted permease
VTNGFFDLLGTKSLLGRTFRPEEHTAGRDRVVVLSHRLWLSQFRGDTAIIGRRLTLDGLPRTVVGVMPRGFALPLDAELWSPKVFEPDEITERKAAYYMVFGRLRPGSSLASAQSEMKSIAAQLAREHPLTNANIGVRVTPLSENLFGHARAALLTLLGAVGCVLLIACANVANLQLSSAAEREREFAIRAAIGAGPKRLVRQLLTESLLLAVGGAAAGLVLAYAGLWVIKTLAPADLPRLDQLALSAPVLAFAIALTMIASILFGLAPIMNAKRIDVQRVLAASGTPAATAGGARKTLGGALVIAEIALALVLIVSAGLLGRSFAALMNVETGFRTRGVTVVTLQAWGYYTTPGQRAQFVADATRRLGTLAGVSHAGMTSSLPLAERIGAESAEVTLAGAQGVTSRDAVPVRVAAIAGDYFTALGIPLRRGRLFEARDDSANAPVALITETLARKYWGTSSPIGRSIRFRFMGPPRDREIVGVVADVLHGGPHTEPEPQVYVPHAQAATGAVHLVVAGTAAGSPTRRQLRRELAAMNPTMPLTAVVELESLLDDSLRERRFQLTLLGTFALVAILLASVGIYGVISAVTAQRTHEIGIRMALGAKGRDVLAMVMKQGMLIAIAGTVAGVVFAAMATRLLAGMLFKVETLDPVVFAGGLTLLLGIAAIACWIPAARASRVEPAQAIREE